MRCYLNVISMCKKPSCNEVVFTERWTNLLVKVSIIGCLPRASEIT